MRFTHASFLLLIGSMLSLTASAEEHPRLFLTPPKVAEIRKAIQTKDSHHGEAFGALKSWVDTKGRQPHDPASKNWNYDRAYMARGAALVHVITGEKKYADLAFDVLKDVHDKPDPDRRMPDEVKTYGLAKATVGEGFALAYDWCYNTWNQDQRDYIKQVLKRSLDVWPKYGHSQLQVERGSNWAAVCRGAELVMMLAVYEDRARADRRKYLIGQLQRHMAITPAQPEPQSIPLPRLPATGRVVKSAKQAKLTAVAISPSRSDHWSFQQLTSPAVPVVRLKEWGRDDLDHFILEKLEQAKLQPNPDADRYTLIRRVAFDLTGLPPTEAEIRDFVNDPAPLNKALAHVVDRYLDSPRFGERWGRHWLDVVRYADSVGRTWNAPFTYAWRYRDYVIDSFNKDKPYDRFVTEQLAGDLLPAGDLASRREQLTATGFLALGPMDLKVPEGEKLMMDRIDEQIDVTTRAMLGLTVACARCHDHKYEPVSMRDYYALAGIFYSTTTKSGQYRGNYVADDDLIMLPSADGRTSLVPGVHSMADMKREQGSGGYREVFWTTDPNLAMAAIEGRIQNCPIRLNGESDKRVPVPARGDFHFAGLSGLKGIERNSSGRLQLAGWMVSQDNPLTARVMVNRVWQHLFGRGLVSTVDNFGMSGEAPTHPKLLDHLATRFRATWSVKSLIRSIVLSRTYRMSSEGNTTNQKVDAENSLYWRMNVRRLELEAVRDSMLSAAGRLSFQRPEGIQVAGHGGKGRWGVARSLLSIDSPYRTVYLPVLRSLLPEMYSTFDFPNPNQMKGQREVTTVAPQSLFLMNSDFAARAARDAADRVIGETHNNHTGRILAIYIRLLGRLPDKSEVSAALDFMGSLTGENADRYRWSTLIQALMISGEFRTLF